MFGYTYIGKCFERIVEYLLTLPGKNTLYIFSQLETYVCKYYVQAKSHYSYNIFLLFRYISAYIFLRAYFSYGYKYIFASKNINKISRFGVYLLMIMRRYLFLTYVIDETDITSTVKKNKF